ncbi:50S ribosomal protein L35 [Candidatus Peregrinibacteria bacterium]|nr:50S ribosomal protein L35 [Candidatus Peregrinibacteria bacterium]
MPGKARPGKVKSSSSAKKRIKKTGKGTFAHDKAANNHLLQQKSKKQKRLAKKVIKLKGYTRTAKNLLPNS